MKKILSFFILSVTVLPALSSCSKMKYKDFDESYSYKTSGTVILSESESAADSTAREIAVRAEQGQLRLIDRKDGNISLSFNALGGGLTLLNAVMDKMDFTIGDNQTKVIAFESDFFGNGRHKVTCAGTGTVYDDTIIFNLEYSGKISRNGKDMNIVESSVECVATMNK